MKYLALVAGFLGGLALAAEPVVCTVTTSTSTAATTGTCATGTDTPWTKGSVVLMQCTTDVYIDFNGLGDVSSPFDGGVVGSAVATSADQRVDFSSNSDPYIIYLGNNDKHVSVLAVSAAGSCKFMKTQRARPWR